MIGAVHESKISMAVITVLAQDLDRQGAVFCPTKQHTEGFSIANGGHPRVYLDLARTGKAKCSYCGTEFRFARKTGVTGVKR